MTEALRRRHRVDVQEPAEARDSFGEAIPAWRTIDTVWASVKPLSGRELIFAQAVSADVTHEVMIRWSAEVEARLTTKHRLIHRGRPLNVLAIFNVEERRRHLRVLAVEPK